MRQILETQPTIPGGISDTKSNYRIDAKESSLLSVVREVIAVCTKSEHTQNGVEQIGFHFRLFCVIGERRSVELQTFRLSTATGICTTLILDRNYKSTNKNLIDEHFLKCTEEREYMVKDIVDYLLFDKKRYKCLFDCATGSGCRHWCNVVVKDLEDFGLFAEGTSQAMVAWGDGVAERYPDHMSIPATTGVFYED